MILFLCLSHITLGRYYPKNVGKSRGVWKKDLNGSSHIGGVGGGGGGGLIAIYSRLKPTAHYPLMHFFYLMAQEKWLLEKCLI